MKKILSILLFTFLLGACSGDDEANLVKITTTDYSISNTYCTWNLPENQALKVINSKEEMSPLLICEMIGCPDNSCDPLEIDFEKNSLIVAVGYTPNNNEVNNKELYKKSNNEYILEVTIVHGPLTSPERWSVAILTPKIDDKTNIKLAVKDEYQK